MKRYGEFIKTDEERMLLETIRQFVDKEIMPVRQQLDHDPAVFDKVYKGLVDLGIQKRGFSEKYGGLGIRSAVMVTAITEEIARGDSGIALHTLLAPWVLSAAMGARNETIMDKYLPLYCGDEPRNACMAITEPAGGCNVEDTGERARTIRTKARLDGDEWVISGEKMWPSAASISDLYCVVCSTDVDSYEDGFALIYVPGDAKGLSFGKREAKMGMRATDVNTAIYFDEVRVPKSYRAAGPGMDWKLFRNAVTYGRLSSAPMAIGNAQAVLEEVIEYTSTRSYGGKPVRNHSLQASMIADMAIAIESARAFYLSVAEMFNSRGTYGGLDEDFLLARASAAKVYACDVVEKVCNTGMELMGAFGYSCEAPIEKYLRDSKIVQIWLGGGQLGRLDVAQGYYPYFMNDRLEGQAAAQ
jgi:alkylation response protein AidB-like acyl-CoA dehydrogenase